MIDPGRNATVLEERASLLAQPVLEEAEQDSRPVLVLGLAGERYAVDLHLVSAVNPPCPVAHVPGVAGFWAGVASFRGLLFPVLDLARLLGLEAADGGVAAFVVLSGRHEIAVPSTDPPYVRRLGVGAVKPPPSGNRTDVVAGVTDDLVSILDVEALHLQAGVTGSGDTAEGVGEA